MIFKNFWAHRRQNGFVFVEIALIAVLSFYLIDSITVWAYGSYFCHAAGEFEKDHLVVGQTARITAINGDSIKVDSTEQDLLAPLHAFRDEIRALPEVQSVCLTQNFIGDGQGRWSYHAMAPEADTTKTCSAYTELFILNQCYFETLGMTAIEGSPSVESLSKDTPNDGVILTRSLAFQLFGTDEVIGRRVMEIQYKPGSDGRDVEFETHHTVFGVVEDVKSAPHERHYYAAFFPLGAFSTNTPKMLIRLKPEANAEEFVAKHGQFTSNLQYSFGWLSTYNDILAINGSYSHESIFLTLFGTLGLLFALNVILGTLGTFWLQIRKRTEDIGIMRSFGAKRRDIFWMVWGEGALLTLVACIVGQFIWLQFVVYIGLHDGMSDGNAHAVSLRETDWVNTFWLHYLIVCVVQYLVLLVIVTLGMVIPTLIAMYKRPVEALRHE